MTKSTFFTRELALGMMVLTLAAVGAGWPFLSDPVEPGALAELDRESFTQLRNEFNEAAGNIRVIVLLSPT